MGICNREAYAGVFCEKSPQNDVYSFLQKHLTNEGYDLMLNIGEMVKIKHNNKIDVILSREEISGKYVVFTQDEITPISLFAEQIENVTFESKLTHESARVLNATLTANLLNNPSIDSLYSLNS